MSIDLGTEVPLIGIRVSGNNDGIPGVVMAMVLQMMWTSAPTQQ